MKKYLSPKVKVVKLDSQQAIIQACQVGGAYFTVGATKCLKGYGGMVGTCPNTVKGSAGIFGAAGVTSQAADKPS